MRRRQWRVESLEEGMALDAFLGARLEEGLTHARRLIQVGAVYVKGRRCQKADAVLIAGQDVTCVLEEAGQSVLLEKRAEVPLEVLFEDDSMLVVNKPAGVFAQPTEGRVGNSLLDMASAYLGRQAGLVHRLDKDTSGITVFGKTNEATSFLAAQFREGKAKKVYLAVVGPGLPEEGLIDLPIARDPSRPGRQRALKGAMGKPAVTRFTRLSGSSEYCVVKLFPETGRTHQLRAHLTSLGFPILGDTLYGGASPNASRCLLHATELTLLHPLKKTPVTFTARVPADMAVFLSD